MLQKSFVYYHNNSAFSRERNLYLIQQIHLKMSNKENFHEIFYKDVFCISPDKLYWERREHYLLLF